MKTRELFARLQAIQFRGHQLVKLSDFAARHSVHQFTVSRWKSGTRDLPSAVFDDLVAVLRAAGVRLKLDDVVGYKRADAADWLARLRREAKDKSRKQKETK